MFGGVTRVSHHIHVDHFKFKFTLFNLYKNPIYKTYKTHNANRNTK